eukprot:6177593-Ditylum_brightwellii.AAC.1
MIWRKKHDTDDKSANDDAIFLIDYVTEILRLFWTGELDIATLNESTLSPVPRKGNLADPNKWRPVCLLETSYKVLASILANRINPSVCLEIRPIYKPVGNITLQLTF